MKIALTVIALFLIVPSASAQPLRILLWDNDNGATLLDPDNGTPIGCEARILQSLDELGYDVEVVPFFTGPGDAEAVFVTNGWRNDSLGQSPGIIEPAQRQMLVEFMDTGHPVFMDGCDIAYTYGLEGTPNYDTLFLHHFATKYVMDDSPWPVDSILGTGGTPFAGCNYSYDPLGSQYTGPQSSVDIVDTVFRPNGEAYQIFDVDTTAKWAYCRGIAYSSFWKNQPYNSVLLSFIFSALRDTSYERSNSTKTMLMRLLMLFFNQNSSFPFYPSPPETVWADPGKGTVQLGWNTHVDEMVIGYRIVRFLDGMADTDFTIEDRFQNSFLDTTATAGLSYSYTLSARAQLDDSGAVLEGRCATSGTVIPTGMASPPPALPHPFLHNAYSSNGTVFFSLDANTSVHIAVYDVSGRLKKTIGAPGKTGRNSLSLGPLASGIYLVRFVHGGEDLFLKTVIIR